MDVRASVVKRTGRLGLASGSLPAHMTHRRVLRDRRRRTDLSAFNSNNNNNNFLCFTLSRASRSTDLAWSPPVDSGARCRSRFACGSDSLYSGARSSSQRSAPPLRRPAAAAASTRIVLKRPAGEIRGADCPRTVPAQSGVGDESGGDPRWPPHLFYYLPFLPFLAFFSLGTTLAGVRYEPDALRAMPPMLAPTGGLKLPDSGSSL